MRRAIFEEGFACKNWKAIRHRSVMIHSSSSISSPTFEPPHDDLPAPPLWTFAFGVLALLTFGLTSVPAIICGHRALAETRNSNNESLGRSVALMGLVIGYVGAALLGAWIIFLARFLSGH
jgi:Na+-translocating ferredoxin:NAD+ oxidoreductase RnfD subunit